MKSLILAILFAPPLMAQTAAVPPLAVPLPAVVDPGQPVNCVLNGKKVSCAPLPQRTLLPAGQAMTAPATAAVSLKGATGTFTLDFSKSTTTTNSDGTATITGVVVTVVTK